MVFDWPKLNAFSKLQCNIFGLKYLLIVLLKIDENRCKQTQASLP